MNATHIPIEKRRPGEIRDAIVLTLENFPYGARLKDIEQAVNQRIGKVASSSIRSYLRLNVHDTFIRNGRGTYLLANASKRQPVNTSSISDEVFQFGKAKLYQANCIDWLMNQSSNSIHAVVTDPPYGLFEYSSHEQEKLRNGKGGVWRIPPSFDGCVRSPLPRFTVLNHEDLKQLGEFFFSWALCLLPVLVPGANIVMASNPLVSYIVANAVTKAGFERRGEIIRLVMTMRGGDRPKNAHKEFTEVSVMPRSMWEPWLIFRKPIEGRIQDNLRKWKTGGFKRPSPNKPFGDVISSSPTRKMERKLAPHPSLKPQAFLRQITRGVLPLGEGIILDPFAGSGSTLAASEAVGYQSIGIEKDQKYFQIAKKSFPDLARIKIS